jgi:MerR family transcriptional regulator, heat shock protein HspR
MAERNYFLIQFGSYPASAPYLTLREVAYHSGLHPELIERFARIGLIDYAARDVNGELLFQAEVIPLIRRILRLRKDLGVNYAGIGVILELMARIEALENHVRELEERL